MFQSEPICILQAGTTVDGRVIEQKIIDEIAETYNTDVYTARINEDHYTWSYKYGSVVSVEKRDDKLFAVLKPNSILLRAIEQGQLLHTSCEYVEKFSDTEKAYLTGLALTDNPASLGTTQIHLSSKDDGKVRVCSEFPIKQEHFSKSETGDEKLTTDDVSLIKKFFSLLKGESSTEQLSQQQEDDDMSKETEELLKRSVEQNEKLSSQVEQLLEKLSVSQGGEEEVQPQEPNKEVAELKEQVEALTSQLTEMNEKFSKLTDEEHRQLAGEGDDEEPYL